MAIKRKWDKRQPVYHKYIVSFSPTVWADPLYSILTQKPGIGSFSSVRIVLFIGHSPKIKKKNPISIALGNGCSATFTVARWVSKGLTSSGYNKVIYLSGMVVLMGAVSTLCSCRAKNPIPTLLCLSKCPLKYSRALQTTSIIARSSLGSPWFFITIFEGFCSERSLYSAGTAELEWEAGFLLIVR